MNEVNWLMVVTAAILIVAGMLGYINGLIKTILNLVLGVVTLVLVIIFGPKVTTYLQTETNLPVYVNERVESIVSEKVDQIMAEQSDPAFGQEDIEQLVESLPFLPLLKDALLKNEQTDQMIQQGKEQAVAYISSGVSEKIVLVIGYATTYIVVFLALRILAFLLNIVEHLPLIYGVNKIAGLIFGLVEGLMIIWILGMILSMFSTTGWGQSAAQCINESKFLSVIYGYNLLQKIIFWLVGII